MGLPERKHANALFWTICASNLSTKIAIFEGTKTPVARAASKFTNPHIDFPQKAPTAAAGRKTL
jgi:hypothetical protein